MALRAKYDRLVREVLPSLARSKAPTQAAWPVQLDHYFARIILDSVVGRGECYSSSTSVMTSTDESTHAPWPAKLKGPAVKNMSDAQLKQCIALAEALADGRVNLCEMNDKSLRQRNKGGVKRTRTPVQDDRSENVKRLKPIQPPSPSTPPVSSPKRSTQVDIRSAFGVSPAVDSSCPLATIIDTDLRHLVESSDITPFRKRVLLALCQVPRGQVSSYLALSNHLRSSPRAVGNVRKAFMPLPPKFQSEICFASQDSVSPDHHPSKSWVL